MFKRLRIKPINYRTEMLFFSLAPIFIILCLVAVLFSKNEYDKVCSRAEAKFEKAVQEINLLLVQAVDFSNNVITNQNIETILFESYNGMEEHYRIKTMLDMFFSNYKSVPVSRTDFCIYHNNYSMYRNQYLNYIDALEPELFERIKRMKISDLLWEENDKFFSLYKYYNKDNIIMVTQYNFKKDDIKFILNKFDAFSNEGYNYKNEITVGETVKKGGYSAKKTLTNGKTITMHIPNDIKRDIYMHMSAYFLSVFLLVVLSGFFLSSIYVKEKQESMYTFVNDLSNNEITIKQANSLLNKKDALYPVYKKILDLLENINDSHLRNNKIMEEKKAIEIKYLQSKFNPHLLYNTLSVLKWKCIKYDKTLAGTIDSMADYYRACISGLSDSVMIKDEIELVRKYIEIMEFIHERKYPLEVDISSKVMSFYTVKHLLQPFVENAILHGIQQNDGGFISITGEENESFVILKVKDNGKGITDQRIREIESMNYFSAYKSYGIKNTQERIKIFHGKESHIKISSSEGEGTCITIVLQKSAI